MIKKFNLGVLFLYLGVCFCSCKNEKRNCDPATLVPTFTGKTQGDLRGFTIYRYPVDSFPLAMIDSFDVHEGVGITYQIRGDTIRLFPRTNAFKLESGYDYLMKLKFTTAAGGINSLFFRDIRDDGKTIRCKTRFGKDQDDCSCMSRLLSCTVNDSIYQEFRFVSDSEGDYREGYEVLIAP